ncbi:MAG: tetratricopeptide repeat protein [Spirochaetia bacterium]|nr:tetratricopeptide repeat protein [Spirochaetia bacterium]
MEDKKDILKTITRYAQAGDWARAIKEYDKLIALDPSDIGLRNSYGEALAKLGEHRKAFENFTKVLEDYASKGMTQKIMMMYKKIARLDPKKFDLEGKALHDRITKVVNAVTLFDAGEIDRAIPALKEADKYDKYNPEILIRLGEACEKRDLIGEAVEAYVRAMRVLVDKGRKDESIAVAYRIQKLDRENVEAMAMAADDLIAKGQKEKAQGIFKDLLITLAEKDRIADGQRIAKQAMDLNIEYGKQFYAFFLFKDNKIDEARRLLEDGGSELSTEEKVLLGKIYFKACDYEKAKSVLLTLDTEVVDQNPEILEVIGDSLLKLRDYRSAGDYYIKGLKVLKEAGHLDEAIIMANKVMNVDTERVELHEMMAQIYTRKNMKARVIDEYTKLAVLYDRNGRRDDAAQVRSALNKLKMI